MKLKIIVNSTRAQESQVKLTYKAGAGDHGQTRIFRKSGIYIVLPAHPEDAAAGRFDHPCM